MYQIRLHGRGGQGVVTAAELIAWAAIADGRYALAFPSFGSERTGAPVEAYCRIDERPIRSREPVTEPDLVIVLDATLLRQRFVFDGLKPGGTALINTGLINTNLVSTALTGAAAAEDATAAALLANGTSGRAAGNGAYVAKIGLTRSAARDAAGMRLCAVRVRTVPATEFARQRTGRPLPNAAMLGAAAAATGIVPLAAVRDAIAARFSGRVAEANAEAAADAFEHIRSGGDRFYEDGGLNKDGGSDADGDARTGAEPAAYSTSEVPGARS